jgi:hypothetical protein
MGDLEESELRVETLDGDDVEKPETELDVVTLVEAVLRVLRELKELREPEVAEREPYGGPLFDDWLFKELLEVLRRSRLEEELLSPVRHVTEAL